MLVELIKKNIDKSKLSFFLSSKREEREGEKKTG